MFIIMGAKTEPGTARLTGVHPRAIIKPKKCFRKIFLLKSVTFPLRFLSSITGTAKQAV